jgi:diguanylate cyclase (GGDEF)-like protein
MFTLNATELIVFLALSLLCLLLLAALIFTFLRYSSRQSAETRKHLDLQKIYLEIHESLERTITAGHPFRHSAADFNNSLTGQLKIEKLIIYIQNRGRYVPIIWHNISLPGINKLYFSQNSEFIRSISQKGQALRLDQNEHRDNLARLLDEKMKMKMVFPMLFGRRLHGLVVVAESTHYKLEDLAAYILLLTDLLSFAYEYSQKQPRNYPVRERDGEETTSVSYSNRERYNFQSFFEANTRLLKIYNENHLMESFLAIIEEHLSPAFAFIFMPDNENNGLAVKFKTKSLPSQLENYIIRESDSLVNILSRKHGVHNIEHIREALGLEPTVKILFEAGCGLIASFPLPNRTVGFLGLGEKVAKPGYYTPDDFTIITTLCQTLRLILDNIHQFRKIEELSYTDSMTGLYNYRYFYKRLGEEVLRAKRFQRFMGLVIFDIDEFKVINDNYGHQTGDYILKQLGGLIHDCVRSIDVVSRYGGEEFCVIMPETDREACEQFMERLRIRIADYRFKNKVSREALNVKVSLGGAIFPTDATRIDRLIYCADMALLEAKKSGRNRISLYHAIADKTSQE